MGVANVFHLSDIGWRLNYITCGVSDTKCLYVHTFSQTTQLLKMVRATDRSRVSAVVA